MRADAQRNRARVLEAAMAAFAGEGPSVPVAEIARRAGVGTGTVSRHFPTKESLYEAVVLSRVADLADHACRLAATHDPGTAFFEFLAFLVEQGAADRGLADALTAGGYAIARAKNDLGAVERDLLAAAQRAGAVRADVTPEDVRALIVGCLAREPAGRAARQRMIAIVSAGLRPA